MTKTSIVILMVDNLPYNIAVIESIRRFTEAGTYELIVVDNGSTDGTREWLLLQEDIRVVFNEENVGFPKGCNQGAELATGEDLLFLNNDVEVMPHWLCNLRTALYSSAEIGAVQGLGSEYFQFRDDFADLPPEEFAALNNVSDPERWVYTTVVHGYCLLVKRQAFLEVGGFDEQFSPGYCEDDDLSFRLLQAGYFLLKCHDCFIQHHGSASFGKQGKADRIRYVNRQKFADKWGFGALLAYDASLDLSHLAVSEVANPRILYVGHGIGTDIFRLKGRYPKARFYGLEKRSAFVELLRAIVEPVTLPLEPGFFDVIVVGANSGQSVHELLIDLKTALAPLGSLVMVMENMLYFERIRQLLEGNFAYGRSGFLLTPSDMEALLFELGFVDLELSPYYGEATFEDEAFIEGLSKLCDYEPIDDFYAHTFAFMGRNNRLGLPDLTAFPLVSILVPAYNRVAYLEEALLSAMGQTYPNFEIILCDNSTTEAVKELVAKYPKVTYIDNRANRGLSQNFNACLSHASGEYISYLFDDDAYYPTKLSQMMAVMLADQNLSLVTSRRSFMDERGRLNTNFRHHVDVSEGKRSGLEVGRELLLSGRNFIGEPTTVLFRKSCVGELPLTAYFGRDMLFYLDVQLYLKLCLKGDVYFLDDHLSRFRWHGQQATFSHEKWISADFFNLIVASYEAGVFLTDEWLLKDALAMWLRSYPIGAYLPLYQSIQTPEAVLHVAKLEDDLRRYSKYFLT